MKHLLLLISCFGIVHQCFTQTIATPDDDNPKTIEDVIEILSADTVKFFYNSQWHLVKPKYASVYRISKIDTFTFSFTNTFVDYYNDSTKAVEGSYKNGKKEGLFNIYFPNGFIDQTGYYHDDRKSGIWEYFYPDGKKMQRLNFESNDIMILDFWDEKGTQMVVSGNGTWCSYDSPDKFIKITGTVVNGKRQGNWEKIVNERKLVLNTEKFENGKFIKGKETSLLGASKVYRDTSYCTIEIPPLFTEAEKFILESTDLKQDYSLPAGYITPAVYPGGMKQFFKELKYKIAQSYKGVPTNRGLVIIQITIDKRGKMVDYLPLTRIGLEIQIINILNTMNFWEPARINGKPLAQKRIIQLEID